MRAQGRTIVGGCIVLVSSVILAQAQEEDSLTSRYYEQLRRRGFYQLAESQAEFRLSDPLLSAERRVELVIELSRTLAAHAMSAADDQQAELWDKASGVLAEELAVTESAGHRLLLQTYAALIPAARVEQLTWDLEAAPFDEPLRDALDQSSQQALEPLQRAETALTEAIPRAEGTKKRPQGVTPYELRRMVSQVQLQTGFVRQARARLSPPGSQERHSDLLDADEVFRKLISVNSTEWQWSAKLGLAVGNRLRDELDRAMEMLDALEKEQTSLPAVSVDSLRLERVRTVLAAGRPDEAAQVLLQVRTGRERLPGEFWLTYLQTLAAMRRTATEREAPNLAAEITRRAEAALNEVDEQVGGSWSRRCRTIWSSAESMERYGLRITSLISRGKSEFLAGQHDAAITAYTSACELAREDGQVDLEMDVGYTLAAMLVQQQRWDEAAQRCQQLVAAHPQHGKSAEVDLLRLLALGKGYDQERSDARKTAYEQALTAHLEQFAQAPTAWEAWFLRGQFLETAGDFAGAFAAYERVPPDHVRGLTAIAAAARCRVAKLLQQRESDRRDAELERQTSQFVLTQLKTLPDQPSAWTDPQVELSYHAVRTMLLVVPPAFTQADHWLDRLEESLHREGRDAEPSALEIEIGRRLGPLRLIALAGQGRPQEAERLMATLEKASATEQLAVLEELTQIDIASPEMARLSLMEIRLATAERLKPGRDQLTAPQQRRFDLALADSYLSTRQPAKAVAVYQQMLAAHPRDRDLARQLGEFLSGRDEPECLALAKSCWQRVESSLKQGSADWLAARANLIDSQLRREEFGEARKLLKVTKLIYAKSWDESMRQRFAELEARMK